MIETDEVLDVNLAVKSFGATQALRGASFDVVAGEVMALLGPNGAGKTTLIRSVVGRVRLDSGTVRIFGSHSDANQTNAATRRHSVYQKLGVVPQEIAIYPDLTAKENLQCFAELQGLDRRTIRERTAWVLEWTGLVDRAHDLSKTFSGGMKRRLNIGCSVMHRPKLLLLDEPTVGVDPQSRQRIWDMVSQLKGQGTSVLLTTHQLDEAQQISDRITVIDHGKTVASGSFDQLAKKTIGLGRRITIVCAEPLSLESSEGFAVNGDHISCHVDDVGQGLPVVLQRTQQAGAKIIDVQIEAPSLQAIFLHLTGKELRD